MARDTLSSRRRARDLRLWIRDVAPVPSAVGAEEEPVEPEEEEEVEEEEEEGLESPSSPSSVGGFSSVASSPSPTSSGFPATVTAASTAPPALGPAASSTANIVTLTAIPHTPTFPSSTSVTTSLAATVTPVLAAPPAPSATTSSSSELQPLSETTLLQSTISSAEPTATSGSGGAQEQNAVQKVENSSEGQPGKGIHVVLPVLASVAVLAAFLFFAFRWRRHRKRAQAQRTAALPGSRGGSVSSFPPEYQPRVNGRTDTKIMDELMAAAYDAESGGNRDTSAYGPNGYLIDEKFTALPEPEPVTLRGLRNSIARFFRGQYPPRVTPGSRSDMANGQPPPVPVIPDAFRSNPDGPQLVESRMEPHPGTRVQTFWSDSSQTDTMGSAGQNGTLLSLYATESHGLGIFHKARRESDKMLTPVAPTARVPSGATSVAELETPSEESTWRTWGVTQQPKTPTRNWVEKCIRAGGLR